MTIVDAPVRRSALDGVHRRLAGDGSAEPRLRWPMSYGDPDGERRAVTEAIGLAEPGLYDKWILRGADALAAARAAGLDGRPGFVTPAPLGAINVWTVAADELWLVGYSPSPGGPPAGTIDYGNAIASARRLGVVATDVSSGWAVLRLHGVRVRELLEELVAEDLDPAATPDLAIRQVPLGGCRVILARRDTDGIPGFTLLVARDEAEHLWEVFEHIGAAYGIRPVGASALLGSASGGSGAAAVGAGAIGAAR